MNMYAKNVKSIEPLFREGRNHFLMRLAEENSTNAKALTARGVGFAVDVALSSCSGTTDKSFSSLCAIARSEEKFRRAWLTKRSRVCPVCISSGCGEGTIGWEIRYADACAIHGVWLVDTCSCKAPLNVLRYQLRHCCQCNRKLGSLKTSLAPNAVVQLSKLLVEKATEECELRKLQGKATRPEDLPLNHLQHLVAIVGMYGDPNAPLRRSGTQHVEELGESWQVTSLAAEVLQDWPNGFRKLLDWLRTSNDDGSTFTLGHRFGRLYQRLYHGPASLHFGFVHTELERYLCEHWPAIYARANGRFAKAGTASSWILATEAQRILKVSPSVLNDLIIRGLVIAERRLTATGRVRIMVLNDSVQTLRNSGECDSVDLSTAAEELGLSDDRLRSAIGLLIPKAWKTSSGYWQIPRVELKKLLALADNVPVVSSVDFKKNISVSGALKLMHISDDALAWLVTEVRSRGGFVVVRARHRDLKGIGSWVLDRSILISATKQQEPKSWTRETEASLTLLELAQRWGMKQEAIYDLVKIKALNADRKRRYDGHWVRLVKESEIEEFERSHLPARELARLAGVYPSVMVSKLRILGVQPKYGSLNKCRQYFYERASELADALRHWGVQLNLEKHRFSGTNLTEGRHCWPSAPR
jgi:hypothetical protein